VCVQYRKELPPEYPYKKRKKVKTRFIKLRKPRRRDGKRN